MNIAKIWANYKWWIIGTVLALIILPKLFNLLTNVGGGDDTGTTGGTTPTPSFKCNPATADRAKSFGLGTNRSNEVCYLQRWLNQYFSAGLTVDGNFGNKTLAALNKAKPGQVGVTMTLNSLGV